MNSLTQNVLNLQNLEKGTYKYDLVFSEIFFGVQPAMNAIVNSFATSLRGDVQAGESLAMEHIVTCCDKFQYKGYEFLTFYKKTLHNKMVDLVRSITADKMKHNTSYDISLSVGGQDGLTEEDRFQDAALQVQDTYNEESVLSIGTLLDEYAKVKPVEADLVGLQMTFSAEGYKKQDLSNAIAAYFGEEEYSNKLQARFSRAIKNFKKFASDKGYSFNF
ncbi:hypothetical protein NX029_26380 [Cytobacillus firmus]|nr:hypothetical protein [Cytobacillus firmus]